MEKIKIEDLRKELYTGNLGGYFIDYDNGYICDIITEIADNNVDIYTQDLLNWVPDNYSYIEESNIEMGVPKDFLKQIQQGQYYCYECNLYENLEDTLKNYMYNYIENVLKTKEITKEQNEKLLDWDFEDDNEMLENLIEHINKILKIEK